MYNFRWSTEAQAAADEVYDELIYARRQKRHNRRRGVNSNEKEDHMPSVYPKAVEETYHTRLETFLIDSITNNHNVTSTTFENCFFQILGLHQYPIEGSHIVSPFNRAWSCDLALKMALKSWCTSFPFLPQGLFWPLGIVVACVYVCVCVCVSVNHELVPAIIHRPFKLGSPNLDQRCKRPWLRALLFSGAIHLDL